MKSKNNRSGAEPSSLQPCGPRANHSVVCKCVWRTIKAMPGCIALQEQSVQKAQDSNLVSRSFGSAHAAPRAAFMLNAAPSPVACERRFFRDERRSDDSEETVIGAFADSGGGAESYCPYHHSTRVRVAAPDQSGEADRLPAFESHYSGLAEPECDVSRLVVRRRSPCSLRLRWPVGVGFLPAAFDTLCSSQPARWNMRRPFPNRNETAPERPLGIQ